VDSAAPNARSERNSSLVANPHRPDPATEHDRHGHPDLSWFLRRELLTIPLIIVIVATLLIFGISPATLLFVVLLAITALGTIWSGAAPPN